MPSVSPWLSSLFIVHRFIVHRRYHRSFTSPYALPLKTPRVGLIVNLHQFAHAEVGIPLGGGKAGMAQHLLNLPNICARIQKMCGKGMAKAVGAHLPENTRNPRVLLDQPSHASAVSLPPLKLTKKGSSPSRSPRSSR